MTGNACPDCGNLEHPGPCVHSGASGPAEDAPPGSGVPTPDPVALARETLEADRKVRVAAFQEEFAALARKYRCAVAPVVAVVPGKPPQAGVQVVPLD